MAEFFHKYFIVVYFIYGLSFFSMGLAILLEAGRTSKLDFAQALKPLSYFGLIHGSHEWFEMFLLIYRQSIITNEVGRFIDFLRIALLAISFLFLIAFGFELVLGKPTLRQYILTFSIILLVWLVGFSWIYTNEPPGYEQIAALDSYTRYSLAIPGSAITVWGLIRQRQRFIQSGMKSFGIDVMMAAIAFGVYGGIGQIFTPRSSIFLSQYINTDTFIQFFGFPIQVLRAAMACVAAIFIIRSLRAFEEEYQINFNRLSETQQKEKQRLDDLRSELLHRTVKAQEAERQRIAKELHDETGQAFTALALGLRGISENIKTNPQKAIQQASQLQTLSSQSIEGLHRLVSGLHPPQLDDLGLLSALRWYSEENEKRFGLKIHINCMSLPPHLSHEISIVIFRIVQEAITNTSRHANATTINIFLKQNNDLINLEVSDDGRGFNVEATLDEGISNPSWGLLGMMERTALVGGNCQITSQPGRGTQIRVSIPLTQG